MRRALPVAVMLCLLGLPLPAAAQATASPVVEASLADLSPWVGPADALRIALTVRNRGPTALEDLRVSVFIHEGVANRTQLQDAFRGRVSRTQVWSDTLTVEGTLEAESERVVAVAKSISEISFFSRAEDRAYPLRVVFRAGRHAAPPIHTQMIFFATPVAERLRLALVIPLTTPPVRDPDGVVVNRGFLSAISGGRISRILDGLDAFPEVPLTLAPSGLLLDALADLSRGFTASGDGGRRAVSAEDPEARAAGSALARLRTAAGRPTIRTVVTPYSGAFLPGLVRADMAGRAEAQVTETLSRVKVHIGYEPLTGWVLPTLGALDEPTLAALEQAGATSLILARSSLRAGQTSLTPATPVELSGRSGPVPALVEDRALGTTLAPGPDLSDVQARQQFLADTATIMLERPAQRRAVVAVAPEGWSPSPGMIGGILQAMANSPWLVGATPDGVLADVQMGPAVDLAAADIAVRLGPESPGREYFEALRAARRAIDDYSDLRPGIDRIRALERRLLVAESAEWWGGRSGEERGRAFARSIVSGVADEFGKIRAPASQTVTFTSRTGTIPLVVNSKVAYEVAVMVRLESDKLNFSSSERCGPQAEAGRCLILYPLLPRAQTIDVRATARSTGRFPLRVTLLTPGRQVEIDSSRLIVRSTEYNQVALAITGGAGGFLVVWWVGGIVRRRFRPGEPGGESIAAP